MYAGAAPGTTDAGRGDDQVFYAFDPLPPTPTAPVVQATANLPASSASSAAIAGSTTPGVGQNLIGLGVLAILLFWALK